MNKLFNYEDKTHKYSIYYCSFCNKEIKRRSEQVKKNKNFFCSSLCRKELAVKAKKELGLNLRCANPKCYKEVIKYSSQLKSKSGNYFCSRSCATIVNNGKYKTGENHPNFIESSKTYRNRALKFYGIKCMSPSCPFRGEVDIRMLDVHHKDGNRKHGKMENLEVLCVWCHMLKTRISGV